MFSQKSIDKLSDTKLIELIQEVSTEIELRSHNPSDAYEYSMALTNLCMNLQKRFKAVLED